MKNYKHEFNNFQFIQVNKVFPMKFSSMVVLLSGRATGIMRGIGPISLQYRCRTFISILPSNIAVADSAAGSIELCYLA